MNQTVTNDNSVYLVSRVYDWAFFLLPPVFSLVIGIFLSGPDITDRPLVIAGTNTTIAGLMLGVLVHAHLVAVLFRSHGNAAVFRLYRVRFLLVPLVIWLAILASSWLAVAATVVATFWDVWHSGAQTFGFARIYDRNAGAPPEAGRRLDFWLNQLFYAGPILAGVTLLDHMEEFNGFADIGSLFFSEIPAKVAGIQAYLTWVVLGGGTIFLFYYLFAYWRLFQRGYPVSMKKIFLLFSTGACSIYTWGFNTWGEAFFIMNLFHAIQYLALMWITEGKRMQKNMVGGKSMALIVFFGSILCYGFLAEVLSENLQILWAATIVISLMHFWYDGFIWSVRKQEI